MNKLKRGKAGTEELIHFLRHGRSEMPIKHLSESTEQAVEHTDLVCWGEI